MQVLQRLSTPDLVALAAALRSGRLAPPYTELVVRKHCGPGVAADTASYLSELHRDGVQGKHIAHTLEAVVLTREGLPAPTDVVELVWTGPECEGLTNRDTGVVVRDLFRSAREEVLVAGFAIYQGQELFRPLAERMAILPELKVRFFLDIKRGWGDKTASSELVWKFLNHFRSSEWPQESGRLPELFYDPRSLEENHEKRSSLHAKCVVVDRRTAFVTSANFTEAAQNRNIEVGVLVRSPNFADQLRRHFERLVVAGCLVSVPAVS